MSESPGPAAARYAKTKDKFNDCTKRLWAAAASPGGHPSCCSRERRQGPLQRLRQPRGQTSATEAPSDGTKLTSSASSVATALAEEGKYVLKKGKINQIIKIKNTKKKRKSLNSSFQEFSFAPWGGLGGKCSPKS